MATEHGECMYSQYLYKEDVFRQSLSSLGWGQSGDAGGSASTASEPFWKKLNPFNKGYVQLGNSDGESLPTQLPAPTREEEQGAYFALSRWDRIIVFAACIAGALVCFLVAFLLLPVLALKPRKFAILWTVGSLLFFSR